MTCHNIIIFTGLRLSNILSTSSCLLCIISKVITIIQQSFRPHQTQRKCPQINTRYWGTTGNSNVAIQTGSTYISDCMTDIRYPYTLMSSSVRSTVSSSAIAICSCLKITNYCFDVVHVLPWNQLPVSLSVITFILIHLISRTSSWSSSFFTTLIINHSVTPGRWKMTDRKMHDWKTVTKVVVIHTR